MRDVYVDNHLFSILLSLTVCQEILDLLPDKDLVEELKYLTEQSQDILLCIIEGKHYGTDNLSTFMYYNMDLKKDIDILRESTEIK